MAFILLRIALLWNRIFYRLHRSNLKSWDSSCSIVCTARSLRLFMFYCLHGSIVQHILLLLDGIHKKNFITICWYGTCSVPAHLKQPLLLFVSSKLYDCVVQIDAKRTLTHESLLGLMRNNQISSNRCITFSQVIFFKWVPIVWSSASGNHDNTIYRSINFTAVGT